uniref:Protein kinase domain-containing protein n=2 Tax=Panagrolaimus sp. JU765 TaxID=591449 RepID=A0AC34QJH3_9BILA
MDSEQERKFTEFWLNGIPYTISRMLGKGAYGAVAQALDQRNNREVALKKIPRAFAALTLVKRALREIRILRDLHHENIVSIFDMFATHGGQASDVDIYLVLDLMETDLHQIIHSTQHLTEQHNQYFLYQILRGLKYLHSVGIVHRDMKPSNLLVNSNCVLKIADFGMARSLAQCRQQTTNNPLTQYVMTRWYRAPELLFTFPQYDTKVDIWSAGCIFAEMVQRRQLFPGKDGASQIKMIVCYLGTPEEEVISKVRMTAVKNVIVECGQRKPLPWTAILPKATPEAIGIIVKMLQVNPQKRCTAEQALEDIYLDPYHVPENEPVGNFQIQIDTDQIEQLKTSQLHEALAAEILYFQSLRVMYLGELNANLS